MPSPSPCVGHLRRAIALILLLGSLPRVFAAGFVQDRLVIGLWVGPEIRGDADARYRELSEAGFNLVVGTRGLTVPEQLALCDRYGLKAMDQRTARHPSCPTGPPAGGM